MNRRGKHAAAVIPRIEAIEFAPAGTLAGDYAAGEAAARALLEPAASPEELQEKRRGLALKAETFTAASAGASSKLARVLAGEGEFVSTGQQPGLFLGPLYSLYKAITAIRIAEDRERRTGRTSLALFWVAADDHDWNEVAACGLLGPDEELIELRLDTPAGREERSVGETPLPPTVTEALTLLRDGSRGPASGTAAPWFGDLEAAYRPGTTFAAAFIHGMAGALAGQDIVLLDSSDPSVRRSAAQLYGSVVKAPGLVTAAMAAGRDRLEAAGFTPGLNPPADGLQIFVDTGEGRRHILAVEGGFDLGGGEREDAATLEERLTGMPEAFTPAAALRPVLESRLLPVAATVLGPGEVAYWAQLPPLFSALGVPFPTVHPRDSWLLVEAAVDHLLRKLELGALDVSEGGDELAARWIDGARPQGVAAALDGAEAQIRSAFERLGLAAAAELPGLRSAVARASHEAETALAGLMRTIDTHVADRESIALGQVARLNAHLRPGGNRQERTLTASQFLGRYGNGLVEALLAASRVAGAEGRD